MLNAWVYAIAVEGWSDLSLVCDPGQLGACDCYEESEGAVSNGWGCLFTDMPHLCKFDKSEVRLIDMSVWIRGRFCFALESSLKAVFQLEPTLFSQARHMVY